jgi:hypothetical protein
MTTSEERALHMANENRDQWKKDHLEVDELIDRVAVDTFYAGCEYGKCQLREKIKLTFLNPTTKTNGPEG